MYRCVQSSLSRALPSSLFASRKFATPIITKFSSSMASDSHYAMGPFPVIPRMHGVAKIDVTAEGPSASATVVRFGLKEELSQNANALAAADASRESVTVSYESDKRVLLASMGKKASLDGMRKAAVAAVAKLRSLKVTDAAFVLPSVASVSSADIARALTQAVALSNFAFDRYLTTEDKVPTLLRSVHIEVPTETAANDAAAVASAVATATVLAEATIFARDLSNERADEMHPARLESVAAGVAAEIGAEMHVLRGDALTAAGLHMLAAVGQAARHAPRYIELLYKGDPEHPEDIVMVLGKGITFDSGGLNIKGTGFMEDMHMDMSGSAVSLGSALAVGRLKVKRNVLFVAAVAENAIDGNAFKPHAIIRSHKGLTVEIGNTDAEGRLVLADALSYAQSRHSPHTIIDLATLTGACVVALGEYAAGLFTNNEALKAALVAAGESHAERLWPMPIFEEHRAELQGTPFADLKSTGEGRYGGACTAAAFLEFFLGSEPAPNARAAADASAAGGAAAEPAKGTASSARPLPAWAHIDIAGPGMYSKDRGFMKKGGTGFGVHSVVQYIMNSTK